MKTTAGQWKWGLGRGWAPKRDSVVISLTEDGKSFFNLTIKGQKSPYLIEGWYMIDQFDGFPMLFYRESERSTALCAYRLIGMTDYVLQGLILLCVFVLPFFLSANRGIYAFGCPFLLSMAWGGWRFGCFDPLTANDIPGIAYLMLPFVYAFIARVIYAVVSMVKQRRQAKASLPVSAA